MANDNPYDSSNIDATPNFLGAWRDEEFVVVSHNGVLPNRCVVCNKPAKHFVSKRIGYNETTMKNMPRREKVGRLLIPMTMTLLLWVPGTYLSAQTMPVKNYPIVFGVATVGSLLLAIWAVGYFFHGRRHEPVRSGLCTLHYTHRLLGNGMTMIGLLGGLLTIVLFDFRNVPWIASLNDLQPGFICLSIFVVGMIIRAFHFHAFNPVLAKEDGEKRLWIQGLSKAFRESLSEWSASENSPILPEPNEELRLR